MSTETIEMSAVIIELDKISSDEIESKRDSKPDFKQGKFTQSCADYHGFQLHCSRSAPAGKHAFIYITYFLKSVSTYSCNMWQLNCKTQQGKHRNCCCHASIMGINF